VFSLVLPLLAVTGLILKLRLAPRSGTSEGEAFTGGDNFRPLTCQVEPDWPASADRLSDRFLPKAALRPPMFLGALRQQTGF